MEAVLVAAIIGLVAAVCLPLLGGYMDEVKLDAAAQDAVDAISFARANSARTQTAFRVVFDPATSARSVVYLDPMAGPVVALNPCDKKPYFLRYSQESQTAGVTITSAEFEYAGSGITQFVEFDQQGEARRSPSGDMLESGTLRLALGGSGRTIQVWPNGTVTVQ